MVQCKFNGTISPAEFAQGRAELTVRTSDRLRDLEIEHLVRFDGPTVTVTMTLSRYEPRLVDNLRARALESSRMLLSAIIISTGRGYSLNLDSFTDPDGRTLPICCTDLSLAAVFSMNCPSCRTDNILALVASLPDFQHAFNDLATMLVDPFIIHIHGARVLDAIRKAITPVNGDETAAQRIQSWATLRGHLRVTESYLRYVTDASIEARHGERHKNSSFNEFEVRRRSWLVMCRFLEFLARGRAPLTDFPVADDDEAK